MTPSSADVIAGPDAFAAQGYLLIPGLIDASLTDFLWSYIQTKFASRLLGKGDRMAPNTPYAYADPAFEGLLEHVRPQIERHSGMSLLPTYSYFRFYKHGDVLRRHRDRPACEISVTINIGQRPAEPWPIYVQGDGEPFGATLGPGDALVYRGCECDHWRDAYVGQQLAQVFLHYVNRYGPHAGEKFDRRQTLMRPPRAGSEAARGQT